MLNTENHVKVPLKAFQLFDVTTAQLSGKNGHFGLFTDFMKSGCEIENCLRYFKNVAKYFHSKKIVQTFLNLIYRIISKSHSVHFVH